MSVGYLPFSVHDIQIICNETLFRPVWEYGVELNSRQKYLCPQLGNLRMRIGVNTGNGRSLSEVKIKAPKFNIGSIWVFDPFSNVWFKVPNVNPEYAEGLTLYEHKLIKKYAQELFHESDDYRVLIEAKEMMRQHVAGLSNSNSLANRKRAAKIAGATSRNRIPKNTKSDLALKNQDERGLEMVNDILPDEPGGNHSPSTCQDDYECESYDPFRSRPA